MSGRMSDEEARTIADRILASEGRLTVRRLADETGGDTGWVSRIVREAKAARATSHAGDRPQDAASPMTVPARVREATEALEREIVREIQRATGEEAARGRAAEDALREEHNSARADLERQLSDAHDQLRELEEIVSELCAERDSAREGAARAVDLDRALNDERERHAVQIERLQGDVRAAADAERRSAEGRHLAEVDAARAEAERQSACAALETERVERRKAEDRLATLQASRDTLSHQLQALRPQLAEAQRALDEERATARRLEKLLGERLSRETSSGKSRRTSKSGSGAKTP